MATDGGCTGCRRRAKAPVHPMHGWFRAMLLGLAMAAASAAGPYPALAEALLLVEAESGKVLAAENAGYPWYPASVTKLMTTYVTLRAVKDGRLTLDKLVTVSGNAAAQQPSKMGFKPGTKVTVDNALKMLMVKSANDMAVVLAEGVGGSIANFAEEMNRTAQRLGMTQTHYVNPNGLPDERQVTSARDLAILARALIHDFPEYDFYWHVPAIRMGRRVMHNYNMLIDRYPGADGMKTGFICAAGFNLVATATRNNRRLIAVVLGASSAVGRAEKAAQLLEKGFADNALSWFTPGLGSVESLAPVAADPPNLREEVCGKHRHREASEDEASAPASDDERNPQAAAARGARHASLLGPLTPSAPPVEVFVGPGRKQASRQLATAQPKAGPGPEGPPAGSRDAPNGPAAAAAGAAQAPWSLFAPESAAGSAPPDFAAAPTDVAVPLPRPRPKRRSVE